MVLPYSLQSYASASVRSFSLNIRRFQSTYIEGQRRETISESYNRAEVSERLADRP